MNRTRMILLAVLALALSSFITYLTFRLLSAQLRTPEGIKQIVVAREKLSLGQRLTEQNVRLASWPDSIELEGNFSDVQEVIGRGVLIPMFPNEPILDSKLAPAEAGAGLTSAIPEGMRAMSVKVNDVVGVAGFVTPGTRVDVVVTGSPEGRNIRDTSKIILENVQVLAAGQNIERDLEGTPQRVSVVTLLVTPEQAQKVALATQDGQIQLALRNPLDLLEEDPKAVNRRSLFLTENPPEPAPPPRRRVTQPKPKPAPVVAEPKPKKVEVELIQRDQKDVITFELD